ncbi:recombinase family protein [Pseudoalteromonas xiamenensis]|uniref:Recombinase family protein n=1 Tax=Pseudoalteromonas xiamenensis TaxID=882626 RepID=A0A975DF91_9GAMM|nr:recombinase family protein [Pseudoalteromonas xiamenensis]QTH70590.1 recombinase family protein [Pseudoalteromonas xiamenensis]
MAKVLGYARVSTDSQDVYLQVSALKKAGAESVIDEVASGVSMSGRGRLKMLLGILSEGDTLLCTRIDRLARSVLDLQSIVRDLQAGGVTLRCTEQQIDTSSAAGKCFLDMLGVFAEFETNLRKERQLEGIEKAKSKGVYKGRVPTAQRQKDEILKLHQKGYTVKEIVSELSVSKSSIYRILSASKVS